MSARPTNPATADEQASLASDTLRVAFVGEVDHGKSTLLGRLLYDTGAITPDRLVTPVEDGGLAFLLDGLTEERQDLFTLDTAQAVLQTERRRYVLIDVPGHAELLKNMVTGASRADAGVIVVSCTERTSEQTRRHLCVLALLGVTTCVCAVTKMDLAGFAEGRFHAVVNEVADVAANYGLDLSASVPVSSIVGANITGSAAAEMPWYDGASLLDTLQELVVRRAESAPLRFAVQAVVGRTAQRRVLGRVESGSVRPGQPLVDGSGTLTCTVRRIERFGERPLEVARVADSVGLLINGREPPPGALLAPPTEPLAWGQHWHTRVLNTGNVSFGAGDECSLRHCSAVLTGRIANVGRRWSSASRETVGTAGSSDPCGDAGRVRFSEIASVHIRLDAPAGADDVRTCAPLGRFMLCDVAGEALGLGIIDRVEHCRSGG